MRDSNSNKITDCGCGVDIRIGGSYIEFYNTETQLIERIYPPFRLYRTTQEIATLAGQDGKVISLQSSCENKIDGVVYEDFNQLYEQVTIQIVDFFFQIISGAFTVSNGLEEIAADTYGLGGGLVKDTEILGNNFILNLGGAAPFSQLIANGKSVSINATETDLNLTAANDATLTSNNITTVKGRAKLQLQPPSIDALTAQNGDLLTLIDNITGEVEFVKNPYRGVLAASPVASPDYTPEDGDYYYNTVGQEFVYYDASRLKWLSVDTYTAEYAGIGIIPSGNTFTHEGDKFTTSSTTKIRGVFILNDSVLIESLFRKSLIGGGASVIDVYKNNNEAAPIHTINSPAAVPLYQNDSLNIDLNAGDILGVWNASGATLETPKGYLVIKRKY